MYGEKHGNYPSEKTKQPRPSSTKRFWDEVDAANARREAASQAAHDAWKAKQAQAKETS